MSESIRSLGESSSPTENAAPQKPAGRRDGWVTLGVCVFLAAVVGVVFGQTLGHEFVNYDDDVYVYKNPAVSHGLSAAGARWAFTRVHASNWHPLTWLSHMLDCQAYGLHPGGHHLTNVLLHAATAMILFLTLRRMTGARWRSAFVAAAFAVHPLRVESVAWAAERKDVLSGLFFALTLAAYGRYARLPWSLRRYALVVGLFVQGLLCKPMLVTLPFVLLLLDAWPLRRLNVRIGGAPGFRFGGWVVSRRVLLEKLPLLGISAVSCAVTFRAQGDAASAPPFGARVGNALASYVVYLRQTFLPTDLAVFYPYPETPFPVWKTAAAGALLLAVTVCGVAAWRKRPQFLFGWLWYLGMLVPAIGMVQVGAQAHADRYTYLPQVGLLVLLTWTTADLCASWRCQRLALGGVGAGILAVLICQARAQTAYWKNSETLWTHALACTEDNFTAEVNLGNALLQRGKAAEAMAHCQKALRFKPGDPDALVSCGYVFLQSGKREDARICFEKALSVKPSHAIAQNDLGDLLAEQGRVDEAIGCFQKALQIQPDYAEASYNLGNAFFNKGAADEAIARYEAALRIRPDYAEACFNLGNAFSLKGSAEDAIARYRQALRIRPDYAKAAYNLGVLLFQQGDVDAAAASFQRALQITPGSAEAHYSLSGVCQRQAKHAQAVAHLEQALRIKPDYLEAQNDLAWELATSPQPALRDGAQAVALAQRADQLANGQDVDVLDTSAAANAEAGRFDDAVRYARRAVALARVRGQPDQLAQISGRLKLYEARLPYHQPN